MIVVSIIVLNVGRITFVVNLFGSFTVGFHVYFSTCKFQNINVFFYVRLYSKSIRDIFAKLQFHTDNQLIYFTYCYYKHLRKLVYIIYHEDLKLVYHF